MPELILKDEVYQIVGAALEVYWQLGRGFLEPIYQEALEIELRRRESPFSSQCRLTIPKNSRIASFWRTEKNDPPNHTKY